MALIEKKRGSFSTENEKGKIQGWSSCRSFSEFEKVENITVLGTDIVYNANDKQTVDLVAIKKVSREEVNGEGEGFPARALRQITMLWGFQHPCVVSLKEIVVDDQDDAYIVMEHLYQNLKIYMLHRTRPLRINRVKKSFFNFWMACHTSTTGGACTEA